MIIGDVVASEWLAGPRRVRRVFPSIPLTCVLLPPGPGGPLWQVNQTPCSPSCFLAGKRYSRRACHTYREGRRIARGDLRCAVGRRNGRRPMSHQACQDSRQRGRRLLFSMRCLGEACRLLGSRFGATGRDPDPSEREFGRGSAVARFAVRTRERGILYQSQRIARIGRRLQGRIPPDGTHHARFHRGIRHRIMQYDDLPRGILQSGFGRGIASQPTGMSSDSQLWIVAGQLMRHFFSLVRRAVVNDQQFELTGQIGQYVEHAPYMRGKRLLGIVDSEHDAERLVRARHPGPPAAIRNLHEQAQASIGPGFSPLKISLPGAVCAPGSGHLVSDDLAARIDRGHIMRSSDAVSRRPARDPLLASHLVHPPRKLAGVSLTPGRNRCEVVH